MEARYDYSDIRDDLMWKGLGQSFVDQNERLKGGHTTLRDRMETRHSEEWFDKGPVPRSTTIAKYSHDPRKFQCNLAGVMHLIAGGPARGTE
jgi:hypothetical protein